MDDRTRYSMMPDDMPGAHIPTLGVAATAIDQYRMIAVAETNLPAVGAAFTDVTAAAALAKVAEGGFSSHTELEAAEVALQALLLHEQVHVLTWGPKIVHNSGVSTYHRFDKEQRSNYAFELFQLANSRDWIIAPEVGLGHVSGFESQTLKRSPLEGLTPEQIGAATYWSEDISDAVNTAIEEHGIPAYLSHPGLMHTRRGEGFAKRFYHRLRLSWDKAVGDIPPVHCTFQLPPMLAIVLDRLDNRADLKGVIEGLREELQPARSELLHLNDIVTGARTNAEIESQIRYVTESFDAVMLESRLSNAQRYQRKLLTIQRLTRPLVRFAMGFLAETKISPETVLDYASSVPGLVMENASIANRTVVARTFTNLVRTEALQSLVRTHLTNAEISAIDRSLRLAKTPRA